MSATNIEVSMPLDNNGFLRRECPYCKMRFKIHKDDFEGEKLPDEIFCPYCGQSATKDEFWTPEQIKYFHDVAMFKVVAPELDKLGSSFKKLNTSSGLFELKVNVNREESKMPVLPEELENMNINKKTCCNIIIKVDENWNKGFHCIICGKRDG